MRERYIDIIKGFAIILVVMGHGLAYCYSDFNEVLNNGSYSDTILWRFIYSFHMPLFMFVSGYVAFNPFKQYKWKEVGLRVVSYLIPFIVAGFLCAIFRNNTSVSNILQRFWYLHTLTIFVVALFLSNRIARLFYKKYLLNTAITLLLFVALIYVLLFVCNRFFFLHLAFGGDHLCLYIYFILGFVLRRGMPLCKKFLYNDYSFMLSSLVLFLSISIQHVLLEKLIPYIAIICICNLSVILADKLQNKIVASIEFCGRHTLDIYIIHTFFVVKLLFLGDFFCLLSEKSTSWCALYSTQLVCAIPLTILLIYISILVSKVIRKSKLSSFLIFGDVTCLKKYSK